MSNLIQVASDAHVVFAGALGKKALAFALADGRVVIAEGGEPVTVQALDAGLLAGAPTPEGDALVAGGDDGRVVRVTMASDVTELCHEPRRWIDRVAAGPNGAVAFASGREAVVLRGKDPVRRFTHERSVNALAFAPKGYRLAVAIAGGVHLWWAGRDAQPTVLKWDGPHVEVTFSPDGRHLVSAMQDNQLHGWRLADFKDMRMTGYPARTRSLAWAAKSDYLATSGAYSAILWPFRSKDGPMGQQPEQIGARDSLVTRVACHPKRPLIAAGHADGAVQLIATDTGFPVMRRNPDGDPVSALAFSRDGSQLGIGTEGGFAAVGEVG